MKAAFTIWNNRISPVFDVAGSVLLVELQQGNILHQETSTLPMSSGLDKLKFLSDAKVDLLVCGAISRSLQCAVEGLGIRVYPFCSGEVSELIQAWQNEQLDQVAYAMPGCGRRRGKNGKGNGCRCSGLSNGRQNQKNIGGNNA